MKSNIASAAPINLGRWSTRDRAAFDLGALVASGVGRIYPTKFLIDAVRKRPGVVLRPELVALGEYHYCGLVIDQWGIGARTAQIALVSRHEARIKGLPDTAATVIVKCDPIMRKVDVLVLPEGREEPQK